MRGNSPMWGGQSQSGDQGIALDEHILNTSNSYSEFSDEGCETVIKTLNKLDDKKWYKKVLINNKNPKVYKECLRHLDDRDCFLLIFEFRWSNPMPDKAKAIIDNIRIHKYLHSIKHALNRLHELDIAETVSIGNINDYIDEHLNTLPNSFDFILD